MNTFFRICIFLCLVLIVFSLLINFVDGLGAFPNTNAEGISGITETDDALSILTGLNDPNMNAIWVGVTTLSGLGALFLVHLSHSITPVGIWLFGEVFWTSYIRAMSVVNTGGYIPGDFILIFSVGIMFLFIAAIIGMLTGSG